MTPLAMLLGAYFHQDWRCEAASRDEVIDRFARDNPQPVVADACTEKAGLGSAASS